MNEANNNAFSFDSESQVKFDSLTNDEQIQHPEEKGTTVSKSNLEDSSFFSDANDNEVKVSSFDNGNRASQVTSSGKTMNWQKVAHKLREYNRKLLKKVFRLEQELAEIENKFNKQLDKSRSSDILIAQQAEEIKTYQEEIANFSQQTQQQLSGSQQVIENQKLIIANLSQQYELSQQQVARIERECADLQEKYNDTIHEVGLKEEKIKELTTKLTQQRRYTIQYQTEAKRQQELALQSSGASKKHSREHQIPSQFQKRSIEPWSTSATAKSKISLPKTKPPTRLVNPTVQVSPEGISSAAEIPGWKTSEKTRSQAIPATEKAKSATTKKPQSLAAVDLPTFPRPQ